MEDESVWQSLSYPDKNINGDIDDFAGRLSQQNHSFFADTNIGKAALHQMKIGYNGRYLVYPYFQPDGNVYSARCVHPDDSEDFFWYGDTAFGSGFSGLFNVEEVQRCSDGALFLCEGEDNLLVIKQLGFPGVAFSEKHSLEELQPELFDSVK